MSQDPNLHPEPQHSESMHAKSRFFPDDFYRVSIKAIVVKDGKVLLVKESSNKSGKWEIPGGGLDFGEDILTALKREIKEEMGVEVKHIEERPIYVWPWKFENRRKMDWFYSFIVCYKVELESFDIKPTDECEEIGWFSKEELQDLDIDGQGNGLKPAFNPDDFNTK